MKLPRPILLECFWCAVLLWLTVGCGTTPTPTPSPVPPSAYQAACDNLAQIGCPLGSNPACAGTLETMAEERLTNISIPCLTTAKDSAAAVRCGGVSCQ